MAGESSKSDKEIVIRASLRDNETYDMLLRRLSEVENELQDVMKIVLQRSKRKGTQVVLPSEKKKEIEEEAAAVDHDVYKSQIIPILQELVATIEQVKVKKMFKSNLEELNFTLTCLLEPALETAHRYIPSAELPHYVEFQFPLRKGVELVEECSQRSVATMCCWTNDDREFDCNLQILELDASLCMFCSRVTLEAGNKLNDVTKINTLIRKGEELTENVRKQLKYLGELDVKKETETTTPNPSTQN